MKFSASYDRTTKIISAVVCCGLLAVILAVRNPVLIGLSLLVILVSFAYSPRGYFLEGGSLSVKRLVGTARIPLDNVHEVRRAVGVDFGGAIRLWGSGGLFGYYGLFRSATLGKSTWYLTNRTNAVVLVTAAKTVLLSPDDPEQFLAAIRAAISGPVPNRAI